MGMIVPPTICRIMRKCIDKIFGTELFVIVHVLRVHFYRTDLWEFNSSTRCMVWVIHICKHLHIHEFVYKRLKLPSLSLHDFSELFIISHTNMKALVNQSHLRSIFSTFTSLYGKKLTFVGLCAAFCSIFARNNTLKLCMQITWP